MTTPYPLLPQPSDNTIRQLRQRAEITRSIAAGDRQRAADLAAQHLADYPHDGTVREWLAGALVADAAPTDDARLAPPAPDGT